MIKSQSLSSKSTLPTPCCFGLSYSQMQQVCSLHEPAWGLSLVSESYTPAHSLSTPNSRTSRVHKSKISQIGRRVGKRPKRNLGFTQGSLCWALGNWPSPPVPSWLYLLFHCSSSWLSAGLCPTPPNLSCFSLLTTSLHPQLNYDTFTPH